jgi:hypothetical protein
MVLQCDVVPWVSRGARLNEGQTLLLPVLSEVSADRLCVSLGVYPQLGIWSINSLIDLALGPYLKLSQPFLDGLRKYIDHIIKLIEKTVALSRLTVR